MTVQPLYYPCLIRSRSALFWIVWCSNGKDGVVVSPDHRVVAFPTRDELLNYLGARGHVVEDETTEFDLSVLASPILNESHVPCDYAAILNLVNLFSDIFASISSEQEPPSRCLPTSITSFLGAATCRLCRRGRASLYRSGSHGN